MIYITIKEKFGDYKGITRIRTLRKDGQHNDQKKKDGQHNGQKKKDRERSTKHFSEN
jgi:hypothetical protein